MNERKLWGHYQKMVSYLDFYIFLLDKIELNFAEYITTKDKKFLRQTSEAEELLQEVVTKALTDVNL